MAAICLGLNVLNNEMCAFEPTLFIFVINIRQKNKVSPTTTEITEKLETTWLWLYTIPILMNWIVYFLSLIYSFVHLSVS